MPDYHSNMTLNNSYPTWVNLALYQSIWFIAVLGRNTYLWVALVLIVLHLLLCKDRWREITTMASASIIGVLTDSALTLFGVFAFSQATTGALPIPVWLLIIWLAFTATLRHGLKPLVRRPGLLIVLAAAGAPLSYLGAARLGAVDLPYGWVQTALILAVVWAVLMAILILVTRWSLREAQQPS